MGGRISRLSRLGRIIRREDPRHVLRTISERSWESTALEEVEEVKEPDLKVLVEDDSQAELREKLEVRSGSEVPEESEERSSHSGLRRGRFKMIGEILSLTTEPSTKTSIVHRSSLNLSIVNRYLDLLLQEGLMIFNEESSEYKTTKKGLKFLDAYRNLKERAKSL